jgi:tetratricopeptide (TPR) repeat protein
MAVKKTKSASRISRGQEAAATVAVGGRTSGGEARGRETRPSKTLDQLESYETGIRLLNAGSFREARAAFEAAGNGPDRGISHRARVYVRMCESRLEQPAMLPQTAEDHYNYGVALINSRELAAARDHLQAALALESGADHIHYALALCYGLSGDLQNAYESLKRAIDLQPRNRIAARQDSDFAMFAGQSPLDRLLYPEKKSSY